MHAENENEFSTFPTNAILQTSAFYYYIQSNAEMENECEHAKWDANSLKSSPYESRTRSRETECGFNAISIDSLVHSLSITYAKSLLIVLIEFYASKTTIINSWLYGISGEIGKHS